MKIGRHLVSFALGVAVGLCLYSLLKLRPLFQTHMLTDPPHGSALPPRKSFPVTSIRGSLLAQGGASVRVLSRKHVHSVTRRAKGRLRVQPKPSTAKTAEPVAAKEVAVVNGSSAPPAPTIFKPMGYVEKAGGQLEAIILQENEVEVVHIGDLISGRYRVTRIAPDAVDAVDETLVQSPMAKPNGAESNELTASAADSLGYVQKADGKVEAIVADGDSVRLVPESPTVTMAQAAAPLSQKEASTAQGLAMPAAAVSATRETMPDSSVLSAGRSTQIPVKTAVLPEPATFVFQALGYVETQDGELRAVVADGSQLYLVKQGETFADQYRATSVDPTLVLAVRVSPGQDVENHLSAQTVSGGKPASNVLHGSSHYPLSELASVEALNHLGASGGPVLDGLGVNLLNSSLTGFNLQAHFFTADNPSIAF